MHTTNNCFESNLFHVNLSCFYCLSYMYVIIYHLLLNVVAFLLFSSYGSKNTTAKWNICYMSDSSEWVKYTPSVFKILKGRIPRAAHFICRWWQLDLHFISLTYMYNMYIFVYIKYKHPRMKKRKEMKKSEGRERQSQKHVPRIFNTKILFM